MAVVFAVRGDSMSARYSEAGAVPGELSLKDVAITTDEVGINGVNSIDMVGAGSASRQLVYNGRENTPSGLDRSILMRVKFASVASLGLWNMGIMTRNPANYIGMSTTAGTEVITYVGNSAGATDSGTTTGAALGTTAWHDIFVSWTGTAAASNLLVAVDGTNRLTDTMTRILPSPFGTEDQLSVSSIMLGGNFVSFNSHFSVDEFVVWDEIIDPTSVVLTGSTDSLEGAARTEYVDVDAYDGAASTAGSSVIMGGGSWLR